MENTNGKSKKTIGIIVAVVLALILIGVFGFIYFNNSARSKTLSKGVQAIEGKEYNKALAIYDIALESDKDNVEVKRDRDIISDYLDSKKAYDEGDYEKANEILEKIPSEYSRFNSLKEDVDSLRENINKNIKNSHSVDRDIEKIRGEINKGDFKAANTLISSINKENLTQEQKDTISDLKGRVESEIQKDAQEELDKKNEDNITKSNRALDKSKFINRLDKIQSESDMTNFDGTTVDMNNKVETIYKAWDNELNNIYSYLKNNLPKDEFKALEKEEIQWIKDKEANAQRARKAYEGGTAATSVYFSSLAEQTKDRCYELVNNYM